MVEQIIRPTGLLDPPVDVRKTEGQIDDLIGEINQVTARGERVLVTTLTKKMAESLTDYLKDVGIRVRYLHSEESIPWTARRSSGTCGPASSTCWWASIC